MPKVEDKGHNQRTKKLFMAEEDQIQPSEENALAINGRRETENTEVSTSVRQNDLGGGGGGGGGVSVAPWGKAAFDGGGWRQWGKAMTPDRLAHCGALVSLRKAHREARCGTSVCLCFVHSRTHLTAHFMAATPRRLCSNRN